MSTLEISVAAGEAGPVMTLSGGAQHLTVDVSELRFADSASIRALVLAGRTLKDRGGALLLVRPQPVLARLLILMGVDHVITVQGGSGAETEPEGT